MKKDSYIWLWGMVPIIILVTFLAVSFGQFRENRDIAIAEINDQMMNELTRTRAEGILALQEKCVGDTEYMASGLSSSYEGMDTLLGFLPVFAEGTSFYSISLLDMDGNFYNNDGIQGKIIDEELYREGGQGKSGFVPRFTHSAAGTTSALAFYAPIVAEGSQQAILVASLPSNALSRFLASDVMGYKADAYLVTMDGTIFSSRDPSLIGKSIDLVLKEENGSSNFASYVSGLPREVRNFQLYHKAYSTYAMFLGDTGLLLVQTFPPEALGIMAEGPGKAGSVLTGRIIMASAFVVLCLIAVILYISRRSRIVARLAIDALGEDYGDILMLNYKDDTITVVKETNLTLSRIYRHVPAARYVAVTDEYMKQDLGELARRSFIISLEDGINSVRKGKNVYRFAAVFSPNEMQRNIQFSILGAASNDDIIFVATRDVSDITEKEHLEKVRMEKALDAAEVAAKTKSRFLANMSHDIRTPMNAIVGFTELAMKHNDDKILVNSALEKISLSSKHLVDLVNDILDMSRVEDGKIQIEEEVNSLPVIVHTLRSMVQNDVESKDLKLALETRNLLDENVWCDRLRLNQILLNLLSNAVKYTQKGGEIGLTISEEKVDSITSRYTFLVRDNGIGIGKEFLPHVFDAFERERNTTVSGIAGTGLGLAITKNLVELMGGTIGVESELGKGTRFFVTIPFKVASSSPYPDVIAACTGKKAVVFGETRSAVGYQAILRKLGMEVDWVHDDYEKLLERAAYCDIVLAERYYFEVHGVELMEKVRATMPEDSLLLIATYHPEVAERMFSHIKVDALVPKPAFISEIESILENKLDVLSGKKKAEGPRFEGKSVLLVEDNLLNREIAEIVLRDMGFNVTSKEDGKKAVETMEESPAHTFDVILMDVQMPVMNGYEATAAIRALRDEGKKNIPIIALTANAFEEDKTLAYEAGMSAHVSKPIDMAELEKVLNALLK